MEASNHATWDKIELSESYLVSGMYDEAKSIASTVLNDLCCKRPIEENQQLNDMLESAGMVLVQALKELGRTQDAFKELLQLFGSITSIPIQVFLAGVCFQLSEGNHDETRELVEEFLSKWKYADDHYFVPSTAEPNGVDNGGCTFVIGVEEYLEVVEIFVISILSVAMKDIDGAVSWVEKASLPEDRRQDLLRRLQSLYSAKGPEPSSTNESQIQSPYYNNQQESPEVSEEPLNTPNAGNNTKQSIIKLSQQRVGCIWWFRSINLKLGNSQVAISNGKLTMGCLMLLVCYILQRKRTSLKENLKRRALTMKKGLMDLWELAFSYQVNPLAAVQPIPTANRVSR